MTETLSNAEKSASPKRRYAPLAANENREDYSLRFAAHSFRKWSPFVVATTALGGIASACTIPRARALPIIPAPRIAIVRFWSIVHRSRGYIDHPTRKA